MFFTNIVFSFDIVSDSARIKMDKEIVFPSQHH